MLDSENPTTERRQLPSNLSLLTDKLGQKAKQEPKFRFYALYDRIYRWGTLLTAWRLVCDNQAAPGIDGVTFAPIVNSAEGLTGFLTQLPADLRANRDQPQPVHRGDIP